MADTFTIGRLTQIGAETTHGVAPAAGATHQLVDLTFQMDPAYKSLEYRGTGRRFLSVVVPDGQESTAGKIGGALGYNSWVYILSMAHGPAVITTPAGAINARQWKWTIPLSGHLDPVSMDIEQGDAADADQFLWTIASDWGIDATRASVTPTATLLARAVNKLTPDGTFAAMTSTGVSQLPLAPVIPDDWNVYMDFTSANLGVTKLTRAFHAKFDAGALYVPFYALDQAQTSYAGTADGDQPKYTFMMELMKDAGGANIDEALWPTARSGFTRYIRMQAGINLGASPLIDNYWTFATSGVPTGGTFTVTFGGVTSGAIQWNSTAAQLQTILNNMSSIQALGGSVTCAGGPLPSLITVTPTGAMLQNINQFLLGTNGLTGGASPAPVLAATQIPYGMNIDFAAKVQQPGANKDFQGLRTREWSWDVVEDTTWGNALIITMINSLTGL